MSLEYYLICRKSYDKILDNLEAILYIFREMSDDQNVEDSQLIQEELSTIEYHKQFFFERKKAIESVRKTCENTLYSLCSHDFVEDTIDINTDRSLNITYCRVCEYTLKP